VAKYATAYATEKLGCRRSLAVCGVRIISFYDNLVVLLINRSVGLEWIDKNDVANDNLVVEKQLIYATA